MRRDSGLALAVGRDSPHGLCVKSSRNEWISDPSTLVILLGVGLRIAFAVRFDPIFGYDAPDHLKTMLMVASGTVPRIEHNWEAQHPPLFYLLSVVGNALGFGIRGGQIVSIAAGAARLFLADALFRRLEVGRDPSGRAAWRLFANTLHAFLPVAIRMDVFFNPESLAATLSLTAVVLASARRAVLSGIALGLALLSKSSAVAAILPVGLALLFNLPKIEGPTRQQFRETLVAAGLAAGLLLLWAWPNIVRYRTPYPPAQLLYSGSEWQKPWTQRHSAQYYLPRFSQADLNYPFYTGSIAMPNALLFDAFGDYYNFLNRGIHHHSDPTTSANGRSLGAARLAVFRVLSHLSLVFGLLLAIGIALTLAQMVRHGARRDEILLWLVGLGYTAIMVLYAVWHPIESDGPVKAAYGMGASTWMCWLTTAPLLRTKRRPLFRVVLGVPLVLLMVCVTMLAVLW